MVAVSDLKSAGHFDRAGSTPATPIKHNQSIMSLLSQKDRQNVIKSLDFYLFNKGQDMTEMERAELNALLNWVKLEYDKNKKS